MRAREARPPGGGLSDATGPPGCLAGDRPGRDAGGGLAALEAAPSLDRGSQLELLRNGSSREGLDFLQQAAWLGADPVAIAIVAWELLFDGRPGLSHKRRVQLERACAVIDRVDEKIGAGATLLLRRMHGVACDLEDLAEGVPTGMTLTYGRHRPAPAPATLNWFVARLLSDARSRRRQWRAARAAAAAAGSSGSGTDG